MKRWDLSGMVGETQNPVFSFDPTLPTVTQNFFTVFAVFFPAVTGIMAGANISGDLEDPAKAVPKGTLLAIAVTFVSYVILLWIVGLVSVRCADEAAGKCPVEATQEWAVSVANDPLLLPQGGLLYNKLIMENISIWGPFVYLGVFAATLSSALASLVGAPRILQSLAEDKLFPWPWFNAFGKGHGASNEPIRAYFLTAFIAGCFILIAKLDVIAGLISNFFMVSYALTNYSCFAASMTQTPGWRPSFKYYNKWLSLFGAVLCVVVMFLIEWVPAIATFAVCGLIFMYLSILDPVVNWGAAGEARKYVLALKSLEDLQMLTRKHVKTFRPQFLVMSGPPEERPWLVKFAHMMQKGYGVMIVAEVVIKRTSLKEDESEDELEDEKAEYKANEEKRKLRGVSTASVISEVHHEIASLLTDNLKTTRRQRRDAEKYLSNRSVWNRKATGAFAEVVTAPTVLEGFQYLIEVAGVGRLRPNITILGYKKDWMHSEKFELRRYELMIRTAMAAELGVVVLRDDNRSLNLDVKADLIRKSFMEWLSYKIGKQLSGDGMSEVESEIDDRSTGDRESIGDVENTGTGTPTELPKPTFVSSFGSLRQRRNDAQYSLPGETIDVWWISDDGGVSILLPHLLRLSRNFKEKELRVITVTDYSQNESVNVSKTEFRMIHLLEKFRIDAKVVAIDADLKSGPTQGWIDTFESFGFESFNNLNEAHRNKTKRIMRLAELVHNKSSYASILYISLPIPEAGLRVGLFSAWLELLSIGMPPTAFIRGNNEEVLTLYA